MTKGAVTRRVVSIAAFLVLLATAAGAEEKPAWRNMAEIGPEAYRPLRRELRAFHPDECHDKCRDPKVLASHAKMLAEVDAYVKSHPGYDALDVRRAYYGALAKNFRPVLFATSPFYFENGINGGWAEAHNPGRTVVRHCRKFYGEKNLIPGEAFRLLGERSRQRYGICCGTFSDEEHHVPPFHTVFTKGFGGVYEDVKAALAKCPADDAVGRKELETALAGLDAIHSLQLAFATEAERRLSESNNRTIQQSNNLRRIADSAKRCPWEPPRTFYEGLNTLWFVREILSLADGLDIFSIGRPDAWLIDFYRAELKAGTLTEAEARDLVRRFLITAECHHDGMIPVGTFKSNDHESEIPLTLGGCDRDGKPLYNELTAMFLDEHLAMDLVYPKLHVRYSKDSPKAFLDKLAKQVYDGHCVFGLFNDDVHIPNFVALGLPLERARDYVGTGCWDGNVDSWTDVDTAQYTSPLRAIEATIHRDPEAEKRAGVRMDPIDGAKSYEEVESIVFANFLRVFRDMCEQFRKYGRANAQVMPHPVYSACLEGCLAKRRDTMDGGTAFHPRVMTLAFLANTVDSLCAIRKVVFEDRFCTLGEFLSAVRANWKGERAAAIRAQVLKAPYWGDNSAASNGLMAKWINVVADDLKGKVNDQGGPFLLACWIYREFIYWGNATKATPDGRFAGDRLAQGFSPSEYRCQADFTTVMNAIASVPHNRLFASNANLTFEKGDMSPELLAGIFRVFAKGGGHLLQPNCNSVEDLLDAQVHPERHLNLMVKVCGFSARFVSLTKRWQDEVIARHRLSGSTAGRVGAPSPTALPPEQGIPQPALSDQELFPEGEWSQLPPKDVNPALTETRWHYPRPHSGVNAALRYARLFASDEGHTVRADWSASEPLEKKMVRDSPTNYWDGVLKGIRPGLVPAVTRPQVYAVGRDWRFFRGAVPAGAPIFPFAVLVDGNTEDGYGGYLFSAPVGSACSVTTAPRAFAFRSTGKVKVERFDGTWLAGMLKAVRGRPCSCAAAADTEVGPPMSPDLKLAVISEWVQDDGKWNAPADGWNDYLRARFEARAKLFADPRLKDTMEKGVLFVTRRSTTWNHCVAQHFGWRQRPGGDVMVLAEPGRSLVTRNLTAGKFPSGSFLEPRLDWDAKRITVSFVETDGPKVRPPDLKRNEEDVDSRFFHVWTMDIDGGNPLQVTRGSYDDLMSEWLPDGDLVFCSTRRKAHGRCFSHDMYSLRWHSYTLFRAQPDGSDLKQISFNDVNDWYPTIGPDGQIYFARWDYIDRHAVTHQNLWRMRPDGTNPMAVWGNETEIPQCTFQPRFVPGTGKVACIGSAHHAITGGPLMVIDPAVDANSAKAVTRVTPGHYPEAEPPPASSPAPFGGKDYYNSPYPLGEDLFLISWSRDGLYMEPQRHAPDSALGLYVLGPDGRRELLWRDGDLSASAAMPLLPRTKPPTWHSQLDADLAAKNLSEVFIADVYRGLPKAEKGSIKEVRVVQVFPKTHPETNVPPIGGGGEENARMILGTAKVEADGSARFLVPSRVPFFFQALDAKGCAWRTMRTSTSGMPGERMSCVGCHEGKNEAYGQAPSQGALAMKRAAEPLRQTSECGRPWGFVENVQPIFDRKCASCHGEQNPAAGLTLTRTVDPAYKGWFTKSFNSLVYEKGKEGNAGPSRIGKHGQPLVQHYRQRDRVQTTPEGPGVNALGSELVHKLSKGKHATRVTPEELRIICTWIDMNATFYGRYEEPWISCQRRGEPVPVPERQ